MKLFKKDISKKDLSDKAAAAIAKRILKSQNVFASYMCYVTKNWKLKHQWIFLGMICLIFGGLSIMAIVKSFKINQTNNVIIPKSGITPNKIPQQKDGFMITENEFQQVQEFKRKHSNLQKERPGLFDSLSLVEQNYYSQKK